MKSMRRVWALLTASALLPSVNTHALEPGEIFVVLQEAFAKQAAVRESTISRSSYLGGILL